MEDLIAEAGGQLSPHTHLVEDADEVMCICNESANLTEGIIPVEVTEWKIGFAQRGP